MGGVRLEQGLGFHIDPHTERLIRNAVKEEMFEKTQPQRLREELVLILKEREPIRALKRMAELHELRFIHPRIRWDGRLQNFYHSIDKACAWYENSDFAKRPLERWLMYLAALFERLSYAETVAVMNRFVFRRGDALRISSYKKQGRRVIELLRRKGRVAPSSVYRVLKPLSYETILLIMAKAGSKRMRSRIADFLERSNGIKIKIRGNDLKAIGIKAGPVFRRILEKVLYKKIDSALKTKKDELAHVKKITEIL